MKTKDDYATIEFSLNEGVATISLNRPKSRNAISKRMRADLLDALSKLANDDSVRVVVITGRGEVFCSGADLSETDPPSPERLLIDEYLPIFQTISAMDKPVISVVSGVAAGIGMSLALACDLTIMADDAHLWAPFTKIGLVPDGGLSWLLARQLGSRAAFAIAIDAARISAQRASELGLVHKVVPADELLTEAGEWAKSLSEMSQLAVSHTKRLMYVASYGSFDEVFAAEARAQNECGESEFFRNARNRFLSK